MVNIFIDIVIVFEYGERLVPYRRGMSKDVDHGDQFVFLLLEREFLKFYDIVICCWIGHPTIVMQG